MASTNFIHAYPATALYVPPPLQVPARGDASPPARSSAEPLVLSGPDAAAFRKTHLDVLKGLAEEDPALTRSMSGMPIITAGNLGLAAQPSTPGDERDVRPRFSSHRGSGDLVGAHLKLYAPDIHTVSPSLRSPRNQEIAAAILAFLRGNRLTAEPAIVRMDVREEIAAGDARLDWKAVRREAGRPDPHVTQLLRETFERINGKELGETVFRLLYSLSSAHEEGLSKDAGIARVAAEYELPEEEVRDIAAMFNEEGVLKVFLEGYIEPLQ
jgi:hypothetical protein